MLRFFGKLLLISFAIVIIAPLIIVVFTVFKSNSEFYMNTISFPIQVTFDNITTLFTKQTMLCYLWNSAVVTVTTVTVELVLSSAIAYAI